MAEGEAKSEKREEREKPEGERGPSPFGPRVAALTTVASRVLTGLWLLVLTWIVIQTAMSRSSSVTFDSGFEVPQALADRGFTGPVLTRLLGERAHDILAHADQAGKKGKDALFLDEQDNPALAGTDVPGTGLSLSELIDVILEALGAGATTISGGVTASANGRDLALRLSVGDAPPAVAQARVGDCPSCLDPLLEQGGRLVVQRLRPISLVAYLLEKDPKAAEEAIRYCLSHRPVEDDAAAYNFWGVLLGRRGDAEGAKAKFESALRAARKADLGGDAEAAVHNNRGVVMAGSGDVEGARKAFAEASKTDSGHARAHYNAGLSLHQENRIDGAVEEYEKALELDPNLPQARLNLALAQLRLGQKEKAQANFEKAEELSRGRDPQLFVDWARALAATGQPEEARRWAERALEVDPHNAAAGQVKAGLPAPKGKG